MKNIIDVTLEKIFNHPEVLWLNFILGLAIVLFGLSYMIKNKNQKRGLFYLVIGFLTLLSSTTQMLIPLF